MANTDTAWKKWGDTDPYFGVLSDTRFRKTEIHNHLDEFFESGANFINQRLANARKHFSLSDFTRALDFGCGVGRLTLPLAENFEHVTGLDVSESMLSEARRNAEKRGVRNVEFVESDDHLSQVRGTFDFVNSYIVLQHIPVTRGRRIIERLLSVVRPGGVASLHFSVERRESAFQRLAYIAQRDVPLVRSLVNALQRRQLSEPMMQMNEYSLPDIIHLATGMNFGACLIEPEMHGRVLTVKLLCRRIA